MNKNLLAVIFYTHIIFFAGCLATEYKTDNSVDTHLGKEIWTRTNLYLFEKQYIYAQNYISGEIYPVGTAVRLKEVNTNHAIFVDNYNKTFILYWNNENIKSFADVFERYFALENPLVAMQNYNQNIKDSIAIGEVKRGMTKKQAMVSLGWPPGISNPEKEDIWIYNESEWHRRAIYFENNKITEIVYNE